MNAKNNDGSLAFNTHQTGYHVPVLFQEVITGLTIKENGVYVDCTFGGGGHSKGILEKLGSKGRLVAFDQDADTRNNLPDDKRVLFVPHNFKHLQRFLRLNQIAKIDGLLADLGVSSFQFDEGTKGFSTRFDGPLDMRMDNSATLTAATIVANYTEQQLHQLFEQYGEVTNAKTLAKFIADNRQLQQIHTTNQFKSFIAPVVKGNPNKYLAQVFQALRMETNDEMGALKEMLQQLPAVMQAGGRVVIITFHSIEDRMVKNFFKKGSFDEEPDNPFVQGVKEQMFRIITKKPITASAAELKINTRSRSAKLRIAEKL